MRVPLAAVGLVAALVACKVQEDSPSPPTASSANPAGTAVPVAASHVKVVHAPLQGDVAEIVRGELGRSQGEGRKVVVYVGATWCEPCQRFHHAVERGELDSTFPDLTLVDFDLDRDGERLATADYVSRYIPLLALPKPDGRASGQQVEGGVKGDEAVAYVSGRLKGLLGR